MIRKRLATLRAISGVIFKVMLVLAAALAAWCWQVVRVPDGHSAVIFDRTQGTRHDRTLAAGWHLMWTWDRAYPYQISPPPLTASSEVLSRDGTSVTFELTLTYAPHLPQLSHLHQKIGPHYAHSVVLPQTEAALRRHVGAMTEAMLSRTALPVLADVVRRSAVLNLPEQVTPLVELRALNLRVLRCKTCPTTSYNPGPRRE